MFLQLVISTFHRAPQIGPLRLTRLQRSGWIPQRTRTLQTPGKPATGGAFLKTSPTNSPRSSSRCIHLGPPTRSTTKRPERSPLATIRWKRQDRHASHSSRPKRDKRERRDACRHATSPRERLQTSAAWQAPAGAPWLCVPTSRSVCRFGFSFRPCRWEPENFPLLFF